MKKKLTEIKLFTTEAPNLIGMEEVIMKEKYRSSTVTCVSDSAELIKIATVELIPKLKDESLKELIKAAKTKLDISKDIVDSYAKFQSEQYIRRKKDK